MGIIGQNMLQTSKFLLSPTKLMVARALTFYFQTLSDLRTKKLLLQGQQMETHTLNKYKWEQIC